jgi:stearoyl-CoA desaturase (delta-9 desaturase)
MALAAAEHLAAPEIGAKEEPSDSRRKHDRPDWARLSALGFMHLGCLAVFWVGWSWGVAAIALGVYLLRAFGLTAFYHRYFAHRSFKTSRVFQFIGGLLGCTALQKGPLWWAAHHRDHHRFADRLGDVHSPRVHGFAWAHMGWFLTPENNVLRKRRVRDWLRFPELVWLDRLAPVVAVTFGAALYLAGEQLRYLAPGLQVTGGRLFVWCFFVSTVLLYHATYSVNSVAHRFGTRRFETTDDSRNNLLIALATLGEGWHNNHHRYPASARQGFYFWEIDITYYGLWVLSRVGLVWDLKPVPREILAAGRRREAARAQ